MAGTGWVQDIQMLLGCPCAPLLCDKWTIHPGLKAACPRKEGRMAGRGVRNNPSSQSNKGVNYLCSTDCFLRCVWDLCLEFIAPQLEPLGYPRSNMYLKSTSPSLGYNHGLLLIHHLTGD